MSRDDRSRIVSAENPAVGWRWTSSAQCRNEAVQGGDEWPKITIVTPSYNHGKFLEQTICSVLDQGYPNLEYIIMDGGSSDDSVEIIKRYERHLAYWVSEKDGGQYDAINRGMSRGTGHIMAWLNSDDMYCPWALRTVAEVFTQLPEVDWLTSMYPGGIDCVGHCLQFGDIPGFSLQAFLDGAYLPGKYKAYSFIQQEGTFWRRELWEKSRDIDHALTLSGDFDLWCRFYEHAELFGLCSPLAFFRLHEEQKSLDLETYVEQADRSLAELRRYYRWRPKRLRQTASRFRLMEFPGLRRLLAAQCYYDGKRIHLDNPRRQDARWVVEPHRFY